MKVLSVFGTRPEAVKMAPVVHALRAHGGIDSVVCVTAQHREMLDQVLRIFEITPEIDLDLMREDQSLSELSARIFQGLDPVLEKVKPDWMLVQGDTTTVAIATLVAYYHHVRVGHVEAGLRTHDKWQPFPEEINRRLASVTADLHFAPTEWARQNLLREGIAPEMIRVTGNPVIDALNVVKAQSAPKETQRLLDGLHLGGRPGDQRLIVVTAHRRENLGQPLVNICEALRELASRGDVEIIWPVHLNPNVQEAVYRLLEGVAHIHLTPPQDYLPMVHLMKNAALVLTDSGGLQEESPALGVPCLVLRAVTERPEGVEAGVLRLVGTEKQRIIAESTLLLDDPEARRKMLGAANPFGDGKAATRIVEAIVNAG